MKNNILTLIFIFIISVFSYITVSAETITVEGENYASANFTPIIKTNAPEFSGSSIMLLYQPYQTGYVYKISYKVNVGTAGGYKMLVTSTLLNTSYTCDYYIQVNNSTTFNTSNNYQFIKNIDSTTCPNIIAQYDLGYVPLAAGENTITFIIKDDIRSDNYVAFFMDCFELEYTPFSISALKPQGAAGVFEKNQDVIYNVEFNYYAPAKTRYSYRVKDFWSKNVKGNSFTLEENTITSSINIGQLDSGWYTLDILDGKKTISSTSFSVVSPVSERTAQNTPFAMDFASDWLVTTGEDDIRNYTKAAKMAGVQWVRERYRWGSIEPQKDTFSFDSITRTANIISSEGLKILNVFHDTPDWAKESGYLPENLFDIYNMQKQTASALKGKIQAWELWNEEDTAFASETADEYSAFLKAGAIGIADADGTILKTFGGFADSSANSEYMDLCMQNQVMKYSDIYNCHVYGKVPEDSIPSYSDSKLKDHIDTEYAYDDGKHPVWVSEGGAPIISATERDERINQAKANVIVNIKSLANGTSKHFWFILPKYAEGNNEFGIFYNASRPAPAYSAYAAMTNALGKAEYKGKMSELPTGAEGYLFSDGEKDVAVFWSQTPTYVQFKAAQGIKLTNIMGVKRDVSPCNGYINIPVSSYPIYVTFNGECQIEDYYPCVRNEQNYVANTFDTQDRIVMSQKFTGDNYNSPKINGYSILEGQDNKCVLKVYNFNNTPQTGTITASADSGYVLSKTTEMVSIPAMDSVQIEFNITTDQNAEYGKTKFLKFEGEFGGAPISKSVSRIVANKTEPVIPDGIFPNSTVANWDLTGISSGNAVTASVPGSGEVTFKVDFASGIAWFYPVFYVDSATAAVLPQKSGICVWIYAENDIPQVESSIFCYMKDGRKYFPGDNNRILLKAGWHQIVWKWEDFQLQYSPLGNANETRPFDLTLINYISIGINSATLTNIPPYTVKGFGYFTNTQVPEIKKEITFEGLQDGGIYEENHIPQVTAVLPENIDFTNVEVKLCNNNYHNFNIADDKATINLNGLCKGQYSLLVTAKTNMDYIYRQSIEFYVD